MISLESPVGVFNCKFCVIDEISIASIRFASHLLEVIQENYIETFIRIESFSNSGKFLHRVVYLGAWIIRRFRVRQAFFFRHRLEAQRGIEPPLQVVFESKS